MKLSFPKRVHNGPDTVSISDGVDYKEITKTDTNF